MNSLQNSFNDPLRSVWLFAVVGFSQATQQQPSPKATAQRSRDLQLRLTPVLRAVLTFLLLVSMASPVSAVGENLGALRQQRQESVEARKTEVLGIKDEFVEVVQQRQINRQQLIDNLAQRHAEKLQARFGYYDQKLSSSIQKLEAKLQQMEASGRNVSAARAKLNDANQSLAQANTLATQAVSGFMAIEPGEYQLQRQQAQTARDLAQQARTSYKTTIGQLREVVTELE